MFSFVLQIQHVSCLIKAQGSQFYSRLNVNKIFACNILMASQSRIISCTPYLVTNDYC